MSSESGTPNHERDTPEQETNDADAELQEKRSTRKGSTDANSGANSDANNDANTEHKTVPICTIISKTEEILPLNTPEQPQPTIFRVDKDTLQDHIHQVRSFPKNIDIKHPEVPKFTNTEDKLTADGQDYDYQMFSEKGEAKITANGYLLGGRKYAFTTFTLPGKGKKLYVLANEAAKTLNMRDAFLLFNKAKNLSKIGANEDARKFLAEANFNISKIKSRTVGLVTARGMFMNFGARVIAAGKRVSDDYWEENTIEQGFTEKDQVFIVEKNYSPASRSHQKKEPNKAKPLAIRNNIVTPIPSIEERMEYLSNSSTGQPSQVLPGQGISGGLELASIASIPKYRSDSHSNSRQNKVLMTLMDTGSNAIPSANSATHSLPVSDSLTGERSNSGLPFYSSDVKRRVNRENPEKLKEIEYLHGTVVTNTFISRARPPRNRLWQFYWQSKSGVELGLTKENTTEFFKSKEDFLKREDTEIRYNEYLNCDQIMTKKRKANPNFLGHSNIDGHKPPYAERPPPPPPPPPPPAQEQIPQPGEAVAGLHPGVPGVHMQAVTQQGPGYIPGVMPAPRPPISNIPRPY